MITLNIKSNNSYVLCLVYFLRTNGEFLVAIKNLKCAILVYLKNCVCLEIYNISNLIGIHVFLLSKNSRSYSDLNLFRSEICLSIFEWGPGIVEVLGACVREQFLKEFSRRSVSIIQCVDVRRRY